ncbi:NUDIX domain protein [uncultured archaeon]|nr:NUDIX domain protein [uncultured archaeon]
MIINLPMRDATLCLIIQNGKILLGKKKRGFGEGKYNGYGGKVQEDETVLDSLLREVQEELGVILFPNKLIKMAEIEFIFPDSKKDWDQRVHIYLASEYEGVPEESEEMTVEEFDLSNIPYSSMWETDSHWLPIVLGGTKFRGKILFEEDCSTTKAFTYDPLPDFNR